MSIAKRITISHIKDVLTSAFLRPSTKYPLGRWNINTNRKAGLVVDYSNEDHCGSCAEYMILKQQLHTVKLEQEQKQEEMYKYLIGPEALPDTNKFKV